MRLASFAHLALRTLSMINTQRRYDERTARVEEGKMTRILAQDRKDAARAKATLDARDTKKEGDIEDTMSGWDSVE